MDKKRQEIYRIRMSCCSFKLLSKNIKTKHIKTFGENNNNSIKLKEMGIVASITL